MKREKTWVIKSPMVFVLHLILKSVQISHDHVQYGQGYPCMFELKRGSPSHDLFESDWLTGRL